MSNLATIPLHELLAIAAHKARPLMGENRAMPHFQELLEQCARFARHAADGDISEMLDEARGMPDTVSDIITMSEAEEEEAGERINWSREEGFARFPGMAL
jgi:hypothetical protein